MYVSDILTVSVSMLVGGLWIVFLQSGSGDPVL